MLISSSEQSPLEQCTEMITMVPRAGVFMEIPTASIISVLMMLSWVNGICCSAPMSEFPVCIDDVVGSEFDCVVVVPEGFKD